MLKPKGNYNLIHIEIKDDTATINVIEYSDRIIVKEYWLEKHRADFIFQNWEVWTANHDVDGVLKWTTRTFFCFNENRMKEHKLNPLGETGYAFLNASDEDRRKICHACAADIDRKLMDEKGQITLHLDGLIALRLASLPRIGARDLKVKIQVSNWCGSLSYPVELVRVGNGGINKIRRDIYFTDYRGRVWWGVQFGNKSELVYCKRMKEGYQIGSNKRTDRGNSAKESRGKDRAGKRGADKQ